MTTLKKLAGETVYYGVSSVLGRFINWLLVILYTDVFQEPNYPKSEYGIQTQIMGCVAIVMVLITYGMETSFFRFASDKKQDKNKVVATTQTSLLISSLAFILLITMFLQPLSAFFEIEGRGYMLIVLAITLAVDAFSSIPFAKLRLDSRPLRFASLKLLNIGVNVGANLFFFLFCPYWIAKYPDSILTLFYQHDVGVGYVFISYLLATLVTLLFLLPTLKGIRFYLDAKLWQKMLKYALPIMVVGLASMLNLNFDKIAMKYLLSGANAMDKVAEYGASFKLGVLMMLFTQAYRYAFEPFIFANKTSENAKNLYADALKFFTVIGLLGFLGVVFYLDIIGLLIGKSYHSAFVIVPFVLLANLFLGIYYSLSLWYKLTDETHYGAYMAVGGAVVTIVLNVLLVPEFGYIGGAYAFCVSALLMCIISFVWGQKKYPIPYDIKRIVGYFLLAISCYTIFYFVKIENSYWEFAFKTLLLLGFLVVVVFCEPLLVGIFGRRRR